LNGFGRRTTNNNTRFLKNKEIMGANSSLYANEDVEYNPAECYTNVVEQVVGDDDLHWLKTIDLQDEALEKKMNSLTIEDYYRAFKQAPKRFDVHDKYFQDLAILFTHNQSREQLLELLVSERDADRWLMRARSIAASTRYDVDWYVCFFTWRNFYSHRLWLCSSLTNINRRGQLIFDQNEINRRKVSRRRRRRRRRTTLQRSRFVSQTLFRIVVPKCSWSCTRGGDFVEYLIGNWMRGKATMCGTRFVLISPTTKPSDKSN
jgi:hypothetical protein